MTVRFIDVSQHDWSRTGRALDWTRIGGAGLADVMCARASYGDPETFAPATLHFGDYMTAAKAAGYTCRGGYHNLIHSPNVAGIHRQVDHLRRELDKYGADWGMVDVEPYKELVDNGLWPRWTDAQRFHDRWYALDSRVLGWYISRWVWRDHLGEPNLTGLRGPLINADYPGGEGTHGQIYTNAGGELGRGWLVYGNRIPDIWQYTASANVPGASDTTDCNAFRGTRDQLLTLLLGSSQTNGADNMAAPDVTDIRAWTLETIQTVRRLEVGLTANAKAVTALAAAVAAIGTDSPEVAAILTQVQAALDAQTAALQASTTDAVAALGEGGAAEVRKQN